MDKQLLEHDERDRYVGILFDLHKSGAITVNRREFGRWLVGHDNDKGAFAFHALGSLSKEEAETYLAENPEFAAECAETARRLTAGLDLGGEGR